MADEPHEVKFAEFPQRKCRLPSTEDGLIDHFCDLPEMHPGPCCPSTSKAAINRRLAWEDANPGWQSLQDPGDPFADVEKILKEGR